MAKQSMNLVELAEVITSLSANEMQTLGKIVMAKQQMNNPGPRIAPQNVPGPLSLGCLRELCRSLPPVVAGYERRRCAVS